MQDRGDVVKKRRARGILADDLINANIFKKDIVKIDRLFKLCKKL